MTNDRCDAAVIEGGGKTYERVFDSIKQYIIENRLKPGDRLPKEVDLCRELRVSRNTMREALKSLQKLGIIEAKQKDGMIIREFNYDPILENLEYSLVMNNQKLIDLINLRITLELAYLEEAMERATYDQLARMNETVGRMARKAEAGVPLLEEDMNFHLEMYAHVDNNLSRDLIRLFWKMLIKIQNQQQVNFDPLPRDTVALHRNILELFSARRLEECRQILIVHYSVRDRLRLYTLSGEGTDAPPAGSASLTQIMQAQDAASKPRLEARIYGYLQDNGQASHRQLMDALSGDPGLGRLTAAQASRKVSNALQLMRRKGLVCAGGEKSGAVWRVQPDSQGGGPATR